MSGKDLKQAAKHFIDQQIKLQKQLGSTASMTPKQYKASVTRAEQTFKQVFNIKPSK